MGQGPESKLLKPPSKLPLSLKVLLKAQSIFASWREADLAREPGVEALRAVRVFRV